MCTVDWTIFWKKKSKLHTLKELINEETPLTLDPVPITAVHKAVQLESIDWLAGIWCGMASEEPEEPNIYVDYGLVFLVWQKCTFCKREFQSHLEFHTWFHGHLQVFTAD